MHENSPSSPPPLRARPGSACHAHSTWLAVALAEAARRSGFVRFNDEWLHLIAMLNSFASGAGALPSLECSNFTEAEAPSDIGGRGLRLLL
jgi:hypothetical protein